MNEVNELQGLKIGDIIRTRTGKYDRRIVRLERANTPEEIEVRKQYGRAWLTADLVTSVALRDGKRFGPEKCSRIKDVYLVHRGG
jgi:hypothetical protein